MLQRHEIEGFENFVEFMKRFENSSETIIVYFAGSKLPTGNSWCSDCVKAWPTIESCIGKLTDGHFVYVEVGDRPTWKDPKCSFRHYPQTKLNVIPTILKWKTPKRLIGEQCGKVDLVKMLLTDDD